MASLNAFIINALIAFFSQEGSALLLGGAILLACILILVTTWWSQVRPLRSALRSRGEGVASRVVLRGDNSGDRSRQAFATNLNEIDQLMMGPHNNVRPLQEAWAGYRQTFIDPNAPRIASTARAHDFFEGLAHDTRALDWWANMFVALGLVLTFLGIVAALSQATAAIGAGGDSASMQRALAGLLGIAATKFWTSIAGVGSSLLLRFFARRWRQSIGWLEADLCDAIDAGVEHVSPQAVAAQQLRELKRIGDLLQTLRGERPLPTANPS